MIQKWTCTVNMNNGQILHKELTQGRYVGKARTQEFDITKHLNIRVWQLKWSEKKDIKKYKMLYWCVWKLCDKKWQNKWEKDEWCSGSQVASSICNLIQMKVINLSTRPWASWRTPNTCHVYKNYEWKVPSFSLRLKRISPEVMYFEKIITYPSITIQALYVKLLYTIKVPLKCCFP